MQVMKYVHLGRVSFGNEPPCLGSQLVKLLHVIDAICPNLTWYAADIQAVGEFPIPHGEPRARIVGDSEALAHMSTGVDQFESGVFAGVPRSLTKPTFRAGGLWTEDEENADLGDAIIELRAFDTSYWSIAATESKVVKYVLDQIGGIETYHERHTV